MNIGQKIQQLRKKNNLSQEQLAEKLSISRQSISKWESDQSMPEIIKIVQLSELFGVTTDYFLKNRDECKDDKFLVKNDSNSIKKSWIMILVSILTISLLGNLLLWSELRNYQKRTENVMERNYTYFFDTLETYNNSLEYILNYDGNHSGLEREIEKLKENVNSLVNYATGYGLLSQELLGGIVWDISTSSRCVLREYFLEANEKDIKHNLDKINADKISQFSKIIDEIVELEEVARKKMIRSSKGFSEKEMADILYSKAVEVAELTILYK